MPAKPSPKPSRRDRNIGPVVSLKTLRESHRLTLKGLAERITADGHPVQYSTLGLIENGRRTGSADLMRAWAFALNVKPLDLRTEDDLRAIICPEAAA